MSPKEYYKSYHFYIENLLRKPDSVIMLAVLSDDHDVVLGFSASREDVLDYIHVHRDYRKVGIGKALLPDEITTFTHLTLTALNIWQAKAKYKGWKFDPFT
jgi:ribosomal protein S18 acetylase RimI-like enzyme